MTNTAIKSALFIQGLEFDVYLGWPDDERKEKQTVLLDIEINFHKPPTACETDQLQNTVCYSALVDYLREQFRERKFRLLEHLTHEIYRITKTKLADANAKIYVQITKRPPIPGLTHGVCFGYGDK